MPEPELITEWTPELKSLAAEVVLRLLQHSPKGDHFELMDELVVAVGRKRPMQVDTEYLSFTSCIYDVFPFLLAVSAYDATQEYGAFHCSHYFVMKVVDRQFLVIRDVEDSTEYNFVGAADCIEDACHMIGIDAIRVHGENCTVNFDPGGEVDLTTMDVDDRQVWMRMFFPGLL